MQCNILQFKDSYVASIPPRGNISIALSMNILDVVDVSVLNGVVKAHLLIQLLWTDSRYVVEISKSGLFS